MVPLSDFPIVSAAKLSIDEERRGVGSRSYSSAPIQVVLDLQSFPFIEEPPRCAAFSKATLSGNKVDLSGDEPFNKIVLPLIKALQYKYQLDSEFRNVGQAIPTLLLCIGVLDAPSCEGQLLQAWMMASVG